MTLRLTPDSLSTMYEYLRTTRPFCTWGLPHADEIGFHVVKNRAADADFIVINGVPTIRVSEHGVGQTDTLAATVGHEACHLRQHLKGWALNHGARFQTMAKAVCKEHGFDSKTF